MSKLLGLDYGAVRTGISITDSMQIIASPLITVETKVLIPYLNTLIEKEKIEVIVVGEAKYLNGEASEITHLQQQFVEKLKKSFPKITIHRMNEMFTSKMAAQSMITSGAKKSDRAKKGNIDMISAAIILQSYLDSRR